MAVWAMQSGKDVYVEKPCSHNVEEGRVITQWARKLGRIALDSLFQRGAGLSARRVGAAGIGPDGETMQHSLARSGQHRQPEPEKGTQAAMQGRRGF